ncbi:asparagine synthase (glutamine-hydrolyzing) [Thiothrix nivea]|uniref:asparagine synthase (glutamine-hydrolyzing) n=1 Tax=Thiothrix nivea (strain ATCC 35100 / DSM 5205 / JP2) TaxID=870187 RepID=A0A656HJH9_THINJ|nr:asparagine synthase (glutamine-hydrolyzing) [Thiothrix nivea]EIJ36607.1 asparagine synthase (glutamine-hydrolyzing) [Thiothrix nivea DSM 5205]
MHSNLHRMTSTLAHRGPDDSGLWIDREAGIALGHRRLAILDLSPEGHQPMASASGRYTLIFNGEIYNHQELRKRLAREGYTHWRGTSDTETLLAAFSCWGIRRTLQACIGMFAMAVWDGHTRRLTLARDRMGEKPLYYGWVGRHFLFGSELKALRAHHEWNAGINRDAIASQLRLSYIPAPHTIYQGIFKLEPGHLLHVTPQATPGCTFQTESYWSLPAYIGNTHDSITFKNLPEQTAALETLLSRAVRQQMLSDVPLGAFLSGGIDSSLVVALMQEQSNRPVKTFTIGYEEESFNEAGYAREVARHLGTEHTEFIASPVDAMDIIPRLPTLFDEPFSDMSQIPTLLVAQLAKTRVTVSLSGDGADELFGGYNRYFYAQQIWRRLQHLPGFLRSGLAGTLGRLDARQWDRLLNPLSSALPEQLRFNEPGEKLRKASETLNARSPEDIYRRLISHWKQPEEVVLGLQHSPDPIPTNIPAGLTFPERMMYMDATGYLPGDILVKVDRTAMGVSLETRAPFLDHRVVEFAWQLPLPLKIHNGQGKWILRQILDHYVPRNLIERPKKGFGVPLDNWLRTSLRDWAESLLAPARLRQEGFFDPAPIEEKWRQHLAGTHNWQYLLWDVLMFQAWHEQQSPVIRAMAA